MAGWKTKRIKYCAKLSPPCDTSKLLPNSEVTFTPMECIKNGCFINRKSHFSAVNSSYTQYQEGDIVIAKVTPCFENGNIAEMCGLYSGFGFGSSELFVLRPYSIHSRFLFYALQSEDFKKKGCSTMTGTGGLKRVSPAFIANYRISVPQPDEQKRIAAFLDKKCAEIDVVLAKNRASIEEYKKLKQAIITQAVTKGVWGDRPMKESGIEWTDAIPEEIKVSRLGLHYDIILGKMLCSTQVDDTYTLEPYYCAADVHFEGISDNARKMMWFNLYEKELYLVKKHDLLVVEGGAGAGGCAIVADEETPTYIQNSIMIVRAKHSGDCRYVRYWLECLVRQGYIDVVCNKATIPHFTKDKLANAPYFVFSEEERSEIADYLDKQCKKINAIIQKKEQFQHEMESYKKSLIYEYVTGKKEVPHVTPFD